MKTLETDTLIRDVNPKSRNVDYWILKHQRAVDHARKLEQQRDDLLAVLELIELVNHPDADQHNTLVKGAKIGEVVLVRLPRGDGCNSCDHGFRKTGDGEFQRLGISGCTVAHCLPPEVPVERYK